MKKIMIIAAVLMISCAAFAQNAFERAGNGGLEQSDSYATHETQTINLEDNYAELHPSANTVTLSMEYTPLTGEVRFFYQCPKASFEQGEAMNTAMGVFQDFAAEHGYKHYYYRAKDKTKYRRNSQTKVNMAVYSSYVYFTK